MPQGSCRVRLRVLRSLACANLADIFLSPIALGPIGWGDRFGTAAQIAHVGCTVTVTVVTGRWRSDGKLNHTDTPPKARENLNQVAWPAGDTTAFHKGWEYDETQ